MNLVKIQAIIDKLRASPEVTKNEAFASFMTLADRVEACDPIAINAIAEMIGMAAMSDDPEMTRRFIKYVSINGPISES